MRPEIVIIGGLVVVAGVVAFVVFRKPATVAPVAAARAATASTAQPNLLQEIAAGASAASNLYSAGSQLFDNLFG